MQPPRYIHEIGGNECLSVIALLSCPNQLGPTEETMVSPCWAERRSSMQDSA